MLRPAILCDAKLALAGTLAAQLFFERNVVFGGTTLVGGEQQMARAGVWVAGVKLAGKGTIGAE